MMEMDVSSLKQTVSIDLTKKKEKETPAVPKEFLIMISKAKLSTTNMTGLLQAMDSNEQW